MATSAHNNCQRLTSQRDFLPIGTLGPGRSSSPGFFSHQTHNSPVSADPEPSIIHARLTDGLLRSETFDRKLESPSGLDICEHLAHPAEVTVLSGNHRRIMIGRVPKPALKTVNDTPPACSIVALSVKERDVVRPNDGSSATVCMTQNKEVQHA